MHRRRRRKADPTYWSSRLPYVRYVWGTNRSSKATYQQWPLNITIQYASGDDSCWALVDTPAITDRYVSFDGSTEVLHQHFDYSTNWNINQNYNRVNWTSKTTTVTSTDLVTGLVASTIYTYSYVGPFQGPNDGVHSQGGNYTSWQSQQVPIEASVVYRDGSGNTLETVNKSWRDQYALVGDQTIYNNAAGKTNNGPGITKFRCLDSYDRVLTLYEYNFQSAGQKPADPNCAPPYGTNTVSSGMTTSAMGPLMRQTITNYHNFGTTNILDEPDNTTILDGLGNEIEQTSYAYDGSATVPSGAQVGLVSAPATRGNVTSVSRWLNSSNTFLTSKYTYFDTGQVQSKTDPCGTIPCPDISVSDHKTTYSYTDSFASGTGAPSTQTNAYLTQITYPTTGVTHQESFSWGYSDSLLMSHTDQNSQTTNYSYDDPLLRLKMVQGPRDPNNGNQRPTTSYSYADWLPSNPIPSSISKAQLQNSTGAQITSNSVLNGMAQVRQTQLTSDPSGTDFGETKFDGYGRPYQAWNPTRCNPESVTACPSESTWGITTSYYDALGRKTKQIDSDGVATQGWNYSGTTVTYSDENQNVWQRTTDALGRLIKVLEPNGTSQAPSMETDYSYNLLNDLMSVNQCGGGCPGAHPVVRNFTYDSLSRLIQSFNPESGWTCYGTTNGAAPNGSNCIGGYDANGNLAYKTDARNVGTSFNYDGLNRLLSKSYFNDNTGTPSSCFQYDLASVANAIGRLTNQWTLNGGCSPAAPTSGFWSKRSVVAYDPMGHILSELQFTPSNAATGTPYAPTYTYDLAGDLTSSTDGTTQIPGGATLTLTSNPDLAGRLLTVVSNWSDGTTHPATLFSAQAGAATPCVNTSPTPYAPFGGLMNATYGNGLSLNRTFDSRLRTTCEMDTGGSVTSSTSGSATVTITGAEQSK